MASDEKGKNTEVPVTTAAKFQIETNENAFSLVNGQ